jgi:hypothetical protein
MPSPLRLQIDRTETPSGRQARWYRGDEPLGNPIPGHGQMDFSPLKLSFMRVSRVATHPSF